MVDPQQGKYEFSQQKLSPSRDLGSGAAPAEAPILPVPVAPAIAPPKVAAKTAQPSSAVEDPATLFVSSSPESAEVYVDGTFVGNAPATLKLAAGKHTIRVTQANYQDWSREIAVQASSEPRVVAVLEKK